MPIWGNFKIAIFSSIYNTFSHFCVVFSDHVLQARGRGIFSHFYGAFAWGDAPTSSAGAPSPPSSAVRASSPNKAYVS